MCVHTAMMRIHLMHFNQNYIPTHIHNLVSLLTPLLFPLESFSSLFTALPPPVFMSVCLFFFFG